MITKIKDALAKRNLTGWQVRESKKTAYQSFLAKQDREAVRTVDTTKYSVSLYQKRQSDKGPVLGMSNFIISPESAGTLDKSIDEALFAATLVSNQPFELPGQPVNTPVLEIADASLNEQTLSEVEGRLLAAVAKEKGTRLSYAEFFVSKLGSRLINHRGLDVFQQETLLHSEFVLLSKSGTRENEFIDRYSRRYLSDFKIEEEVAESAQYARDATVATLPKTGRFPVILSDEPLDNLFNPLIARCSARLKYNRMLEVELGKSVVTANPKGDTVSLWSNPLLKGGLGSYAFDSYGTPGQRTCLIEKNSVKTLLADQRYSDYLKIPVTGELGNFEVEAGSVAYQDMRDPKKWGSPVVYQLQAFSAFEPNAITGAFSAEIRAGFEISASGVKPIKGGSVSGVLQSDMNHMYLSKELVQRERSLVPKAILFSALDITGN